jgi:hypothetical protein
MTNGMPSADGRTTESLLEYLTNRHREERPRRRHVITL